MCTSTTAKNTFAVHGLSEQLVSDDGAQFISSKFAHFMKGNGIKHFRGVPFLLAVNGLVDHFIQKSWGEGN